MILLRTRGIHIAPERWSLLTQAFKHSARQCNQNSAGMSLKTAKCWAKHGYFWVWVLASLSLHQMRTRGSMEYER